VPRQRVVELRDPQSRAYNHDSVVQREYAKESPSIEPPQTTEWRQFAEVSQLQKDSGDEKPTENEEKVHPGRSTGKMNDDPFMFDQVMK